MINRRKITKSIAYAILLCFTSLTGAQPLYAIPANTQLPTGPDGAIGTPGIIAGKVQHNIVDKTLTLTQTGTTSVLEWGNFSIGADASVNFVGQDGKTFTGLNSLNYVAKDGPISEIYGQLTALGGNIFIANPAGVQIGNSAQINVGSLYVTNKDIGDALNGVDENTEYSKIKEAIQAPTVKATNAELMSLGAIVDAKNVTFDGGRIVLDTDRIYQTNDVTGEPTPVKDAALKGILNIRTTDADEVVLGYTAYKNNTYDGQSKEFNLSDGNGTSNVYNGYMWVENLEQLRAMDSNLSGNYALRNSIDANATATDGAYFTPIGSFGNSGPFSGRFDGLGYSIFGLTVNVTKDSDPAGLFGFTSGATIRNFTLNGGSISGTKYVGAAVGSASGGTIENITSAVNTVKGKGGTDDNGVGGIVGYAGDVTMSGLINIGTVSGTGDSSSNIGGVVGKMSDGSLTGVTYNLGHVSGSDDPDRVSDSYNVGGIVGLATNGAEIGNEVTEDNPNAFQIYNQLDVEGGYNVGGIVGSISGGTVTNAANHGDVTATGCTTETYKYHTVEQSGNTATIERERTNVNVANAGGIAGRSDSDSTIRDVVNSGNVTSIKKDVESYYIAGNVGGIVGRAEDTAIENAENKENTVAGAHNVGGIAGYLGGKSKINVGVNNGGDITGTGARTDFTYTDTYYKYNETSKAFDIESEVEYNDGYVRERVRPYGQYKEDEIFIVGNIGGIAGYIYDDATITSDATITITNSGNRGTVHSALIEPNTVVDNSAKAANVGGVVGKISQLAQDVLGTIKDTPESATVYGSYNTGDVQGYTGVGGVVGSMYNGSVAGSYNLGTLKSTRKASSGSLEPLNMGGVVGDTTEDAGANAVIYDVYNAGTIGDNAYNYYGRHVGGVVGRLSGNLEKAYNTGKIYNGYSTVGGIAGWWNSGTITNVFNTGNVTVRVDWTEDNAKTNGSQVGGIIGASNGNGGDKTLENAYNLGTIRSFALSDGGNWYDANATRNSIGGIIGSIHGNNLTIKNVYTTNNLFAATSTSANGEYESRTQEDWTTHSDAGGGFGAIAGVGATNAKEISNAYYVQLEAYKNVFKSPNNNEVTGTISTKFDKSDSYNGFNFVNQNGTSVKNDNEGFDDTWRIYGGTTPILNAFLPNAENYFSDLNSEALSGLGIADGGIQYGTAANPLLTIINAKTDSNVTLDWGELNSSGNASFAVYNGGLTLKNFDTGDGYYRGTLYAEKALNITGADDKPFQLGSSANLYGTEVDINANGDATIYGSVTSTNGSLSIDGDDIEIIGKLESSAEGGTYSVKNIAKKMTDTLTGFFDNLSNPNEAVSTVSDAYAITTDEAEYDGSISVTASGNAEILYGNLATGSVASGGSFSVMGTESVYVDSDISGVGGDISLESNGEVLLDITNIAAAAATENDNGKENLLTFLEGYAKDGNKNITLESGNDDTIIAVDMWNNGAYDFTKYDGTDTTLRDALDNLNLDGGLAASDITHIWISDENQLKGVQTAAKNNNEILGYNFALKGDINAAAMEDGYEAIGGDTGYSGTFDGRGFRIIGLNSGVKDENKENASEGIFSKLSGTVKDLRVYASKFFGNADGNAGAIAAEVEKDAVITGVTTFGNHVEAGANGNAGGIAGTNAGKITDSTASDSVIANNGAAGGVAGTNSGTIGEEETFVTAHSAVSGADAIGGIVGENKADGKVYLANSLGVTTGTNNVGGVAGKNSGEMHSLYNESIVSGKDNVGGVAGDNSGTMTNAVNTTAITAAGENAGGIAGYNSENASITSGRNAGAINGTTNVGGMVGKNDGTEQDDGAIKGGILTNLSNALVAAITGKTNVGGIAGSNAGEIMSDDNLTNEGTVSGNQYVGGIAGANSGTIENVTSDTLVLEADGTDAKYFGGIAGTNSGTITDATNKSSVTAEDATYVGGIAGENTETGRLTGTLTNIGTVKGEANVGGLAGINKNLLIGSEEEHLKVTNTGTVTATEGSAGGIFYENTGEIKYADLTNSGTIDGEGQESTGGLFGKNSGTITDSKLTNSGEVTGGVNTGGLIGENTGTITNSTLTNSGTVTGGDNTGGLFGSNTGDATKSSLINEYVAKVTGGKNTGGLIGYNTGTITGGRNDADTMYVHKVYNNGEVSGATNVGGLIGYNADESGKRGSLTAAYNTGLVYVADGGSGENVGGIAGTNAGAISSVFNTVMTAEGSGEIIRGTTNVGGIVGSNSGTLANAYNTTGVVSDGTKGNAVGSNSGTVTNVYATNTDGKLIGKTNGGTESNVYTFAKGDTSAEVIDEDGRDQSDSYRGFDFKDSDDDDAAVWKSYDGYNTPLLKVFLTEAKYTDKGELVYNASEQKANGSVTTADGTAYKNVETLISLANGNKNAGDYMAYYSSQIAASGEGDEFNPNNLGYDIESNSYNIAKAQLNVTLDNIYRVYGDTTMYDKEMQTAYDGYEDFVNLGDDGFNESMKNELKNVTITKIADGAVEGLDEGKTDTNDAGRHTWSAEVQLGALANNYEFDGDNDIMTAYGESIVTPAELHVTLDSVSREYGNLDKANYDYGFVEGFSLVNGDSRDGLSLSVTYDGAIAEGSINKPTKTEDVGDYTWRAKLNGNILKNYNVSYKYGETVSSTVGTGSSTVTRAKLHVTLGDAKHTYGNKAVTNNGGKYVINGEGLAFVNGDSYSASDFTVTMTGDSALIGGEQGGKVTKDVYDKYEWTGTVSGNDDRIKKNYEISVDGPGKSIVEQANLDITLDNVERTYGDTTLINGTSYGFVSYDGLTNGDEKNRLKFTYNSEYITDGGLYGDRTSDAGSYTWTIKADKYNDAFSGVTNLTKNYKINFTEDSGKSTVHKRELSISSILATIIYGDQNNEGFDVTVGELTGFAEGYGDEGNVKLNEAYFNDTTKGTFSEAYEANRNGRKTADAGNYDDGITYDGLSEKNLLSGTRAHNYKLADTVIGNVKVDKASLTIKANDYSMEVGDVPSFTGTTLDELQNMLVNSDRLPEDFAYSFGVEDESIFDAAGTYKDLIGLFYNGGFYSGIVGGELGNLFSNYNVTVNPGTLTVRLPQDDGFIDNYGHLHWLHRGGDRHWNFRERKAEIYFHEGGMDYEENM